VAGAYTARGRVGAASRCKASGSVRRSAAGVSVVTGVVGVVQGGVHAQKEGRGGRTRGGEEDGAPNVTLGAPNVTLGAPNVTAYTPRRRPARRPFRGFPARREIPRGLSHGCVALKQAVKTPVETGRGASLKHPSKRPHARRAAPVSVIASLGLGAQHVAQHGEGQQGDDATPHSRRHRPPSAQRSAQDKTLERQGGGEDPQAIQA
jgi:hypothetical protein